MSSTSPFSFPNPAELLSRSGSIPQYLYTAPTGGGGGHSESPGEFSSQSTVTSIKTEKWSNSSSDQVAFEGHRLPQTGSQEGSHSSIDRLALLASVASDSVFGLGSTSPSLSTYMAGSNVHSDALQTLHLMNPNFTGYGDSSNPGSNMVLFSPGQGAATSHGTSLGSSDQQHQHQHYFGYSLPATMAPSASLSHQSHMASMAITELGHQDSPHDYYAKRSSSQGYNWGGGSEFSFLPSSQGTPTNPSLTSQMNLVKSAQAASSVGISQYGVGNAGQMSYHDQASLFTNSGMTVHGVSADNSQAPSGAGHILSLSLSPQQPSMMQQLHGFPMQQNESATNFFHGLSNMETENTLSKEDLFSNRGSGANVGGSFTVPACDNMLGVGYQGPSHPAENRHAADMLASRFTVGSYGSKYLKPAQELLNEVVSIGRGIKGNALKRSKPQLWTASTTDVSDISFVQSMNATDVSCKAMVSWSGEKEGESVVASLPGNMEHATDNVELSAAERQELHARRAKLVGMRDEVDRRYKQYYHQLQMSVTSFESAMGLGAATAYTALALQTISKHFRCLRDAITSQIQVTCKRLGEEASGFARGDTSRLRFIDQQLRQQRALRQLGMMQQQAWRPQRGLPEHSVSILRAWLFEHFLHPYPKDADKIMLANQTGLNRNQVSNWFINARVRLWKPMVEEMYLEETREAEAEKGGDKSGVSEGDAGEDDGVPCNNTTKPSKQAKLSDESHGTYNPDGKGQSSYATDTLQNKALTGSPSDNAFLHEKEGLMQGAMKPRNLPQNTSLLPPGLNMVVDKSVVEGASEGQNMTRIEVGYKESYAAQSGFGPADHLNLSAYGSYQINNSLSRYGHESFGASSNGANAGVSLTLGLQHCDGLSFSGSQQHYGQGTTHLYAGRREDDGVGAANYYNVNESSFEGLGIQNRKPFPAHMLCHDFVV